ncbi:hypothetical protein CkaCkLH20_00371 [Colletotrichum karsti]|uniref:Uncharacterized protein n=1 Tax=Colletotrichum karsti TaxID=1095194 RepID=A0A9P6IGD5_9PEZI|nr:uncharacterized protein CkaCkLH20_00371 [Colletotrichum karsti]KAF9882335.1 hypothetical protein CkaCkLH20_00371 [Colletotrichum karsti]
MKKKSMSTLASLAPRRRDKGNTNKNRAIDPQEISAPSLPTSTPVADPARRPVETPGTSETVDRLASALLDSTIYAHPNGLASHPSVLLCNVEPFTAAPESSPNNLDMENNNGGPVVVYPNEENAVSGQTRTKTNAFATPPAIPRRSSRRRAKRNKKVEVFTDIQAPVPKRPFPQSRTTVLDAGFDVGFEMGKKSDPFITGSTTAPLGRLAKQTGGRTAHDLDATSPNIVNDKLAAMLAATEALKPGGSQNNTPVSSAKPSRFKKSNNLMSKVRKAFDVFQPKPTTPESKIRGKISAPVGLTTCDLPNPATHYHLEEVEQPSPVSSIEIRLNEGSNLNNQKVRSIVGGRIRRKPVPDDGRSLRSRGSGSGSGSVSSFRGDPFSEPLQFTRTPTPFEHRLKTSIDSDSIPPVPRLNPFESERYFDDNLEGFLPDKPLCASTPRNRNGKKAVPFESPSYRCAKIDGRHQLSGGVSGGIGQRKLKLDLEGVRLFHDNTDLSMKKHPSPSKADLNDLETQFRAYAIEQIKKAPSHEQDELVTKFAGLIGPNALTPRDKNLPMKACSSKEDTGNEFSVVSERKYTRDASVLSTRQSRIPRPVEPATTLPTRRFGLQRQPANLSALEIDELQ